MLAHLADLHLGCGAEDEDGGGRIREADVRDAFQRAVRALARLKPDVVLLTGDLFDTPTPPPTAVATLVQGVRTLTRALPRTPILLLGGARDTPLPAGEAGPLAILESLPRVVVATASARPVFLREQGIHVHLIPHAALRSGLVVEPPRPHPDFQWNVLALHALAGGGEGDPAIDPSGWSWVALGGEHVGWSPAPRTRWAGSLARVSEDPWTDGGEERGFLTIDLASGTFTRHPLPGRPAVEAALIRRGRQELPRVNARLRAAVEAIPGGVEGRWLRLQVEGVQPEERLLLDRGLLSVLRRSAAHLDLNVRSREGGDEAPLPPCLGGRGVRGVVGGAARERERLLLEWRSDGPDGLPSPPGPEDATATPEEELLWTGKGPESPQRFLESAAHLLEGLAGIPTATGEEDPSGAGEDPGLVHGPSDPQVPVEGSPARPDAGGGEGGELLALRAEAAEVDGEVVALLVEWMRERQDAETQLQTHRDRARELRTRLRAMEGEGGDSPCPTCGRPLADHLGGVVSALREEWEALVQDGRWWRRRREQLEVQPEALRVLETRAFHLHAEIEALATDLNAAPTRQGVERTAPASPSLPVVESSGAPSVSSEREALLARSSDLLNRFTRGRMSGIVEREGEIALVQDGERVQALSGGDRALVRVALHLALVELALRAGAPPALLRLGGDLPLIDPSALRPLLIHLVELAPALPGILVHAAPSALGGMTDVLDGVVELLPGADPAGRSRVRLHPGGRVRIRIG